MKLYLNKKYPCPICGQTFHLMELLDHCYTTHASERWSIQITFDSPAGGETEEEAL